MNAETITTTAIEEDDTMPHFLGYEEADDTIPHLVGDGIEFNLDAEWRSLLATSEVSPPDISPAPTPHLEGHPKKEREHFGAYLRRHRQASSITLEEVSRVTKISVRTLASIEEGRLDALPARVFLTGHLTAFARVVGCAPSEVLERLNRDHPPGSA